MLPDAHTWLSFSITIPLRSCLCMETPPTSIAYFSGRRKPGVVLRVPATSPCQPLATAMAWRWEQRVAIPEVRAKQLRAGLSPRRRHLAGPVTTAVTVTSPGPVQVREKRVGLKASFTILRQTCYIFLVFFLYYIVNICKKHTFLSVVPR